MSGRNQKPGCFLTLLVFGGLLATVIASL